MIASHATVLNVFFYRTLHAVGEIASDIISTPVAAVLHLFFHLLLVCSLGERRWHAQSRSLGRLARSPVEMGRGKQNSPGEGSCGPPLSKHVLASCHVSGL